MTRSNVWPAVHLKDENTAGDVACNGYTSTSPRTNETDHVTCGNCQRTKLYHCMEADRRFGQPHHGH